MDSLFEHYKRTGYLHHAHIIEGGAVEFVPALLLAVRQYLGIVAQGNPNVMVMQCESFGVDEARSLKEAQIQSAFGGGRKIFIIGTQSFTREAQNALLKTFEEPTPDTHFFIIVPRLNSILPTLKSRVIMVGEKKTSHLNFDSQNLGDQAEKFLESTLEQRFAFAKKITESKKGEQVDREKIRRILDHIEHILYSRMKGKPSEGIFRELFQAKTYLADRGSSAKMLLEHLAIAIPVK